MKAIFNAKYYYEAGSFTDPEALSKYALSCIRIEPHPIKGALIIATEGHMLGIWHDEHGSCTAPVLLFHDAALNRLCGAIDNECDYPQSRVMVVNDDDTVTIANGSPSDVRDFLGVIHGLIIDGDYPDWRNVLPKEETSRMDINPEYLDVFKQLSERQPNVPRLIIWVGRESEIVSHDKERVTPVVIKVDERPDFVGFVMGMRPADVEWPGKELEPLRPMGEKHEL